jgi:cob(I)alamin adenosyltransferase
MPSHALFEVGVIMSSFKVYTRTGDQGTTSLFGGARVVKDDPRLEAYGTLDELNSFIGLLIADIENETWTNSSIPETARIIAELLETQEEIFVIGSHLATQDESVRTKLPTIDKGAAEKMEGWMDRMSSDLKPLRHFVLPGGTRPAASAHVCRTVARRAERTVVSVLSLLTKESGGTHKDAAPEWLKESLKHINRLNDYFFVLARHLNRLGSKEEPIWDPKK